MKYARAKRAKILCFIVNYANLWGFCCRRRRGSLFSKRQKQNKDISDDDLVETPQVSNICFI